MDKRTSALVKENAQLKLEIEERKKSEKSFRTLAENANDGIILIEGCGKIVYVNSWFGKISGYSVPELLKNGVNKLIDPGESDVLYDGSRPIPGYSGMELSKVIGRASQILVTTDTILKTISKSILSADRLSRLDGIITTLEQATGDFKTSASELKTLLGGDN